MGWTVRRITVSVGAGGSSPRASGAKTKSSAQTISGRGQRVPPGERKQGNQSRLTGAEPAKARKGGLSATSFGSAAGVGQLGLSDSSSCRCTIHEGRSSYEVGGAVRGVSISGGGSSGPGDGRESRSAR